MESLVIANKVRVKSTRSVRVCKKLFMDEKTADVYFEFIFEDQRITIPAHKCILINSSDVFATMFDGRWKEKETVEIEDAPADAFEEFLQFIYLDEPDMTIANIPKIMYLAKKYQMNDCLDICEQTLRHEMKLDDICTVLDLALTFDRNELKKHCLKMIGENTSTVLCTEAFLGCSKNALKCVLEGGHVNCDESRVFEACMDWAKLKCQENKVDVSSVSNLKYQLGDCFHHIQFRLMTPQQVSDCVVNYRGLFNPEEMEDLLAVHSQKHSLRVFKNINRIPQWLDDSAFIHQHWRVGYQDCHNISSYSSVSKGASFRVKKKMLFGAISSAYLYCERGATTELTGKISVLETTYETADGESSQPKRAKVTLLSESIRFLVGDKHKKFDFSRINYTKFNKVVEVSPHNEYEIRIDFDHDTGVRYCFSTGGLNTDNQSSSDIEYVDIGEWKDVGFITCLYFIPYQT